MSKSWHIVNVIKEKGPLTQLQLWNNLKGYPAFKSRDGMKVVLKNLRSRDRIVAMPVQDNINMTKDHLYMVTAKQANFIPRDLSVSQLEKKKVAGQELRAFIKDVENAEKTLHEQYNATHPIAAQRYKDKLAFKVKFAKSAVHSRKKLRKEQRLAAEQREEAKELKLFETQQSLKLTRSSRIHVKTQETPHQKRLALELNRLAGARKRIHLMQADLVKKGAAKALKRNIRVNKLNKAGKIGTPERKAEADNLRLADEKHAKRMSKWRKTRAVSDAKKAAITSQSKPVENVDINRALGDSGVSAAPASYLRDAAKSKLEKQRTLEIKAQAKAKSVQNKANKKQAKKQQQTQEQP